MTIVEKYYVGFGRFGGATLRHFYSHESFQFLIFSHRKSHRNHHASHNLHDSAKILTSRWHRPIYRVIYQFARKFWTVIAKKNIAFLVSHDQDEWLKNSGLGWFFCWFWQAVSTFLRRVSWIRSTNENDFVGMYVEKEKTEEAKRHRKKTIGR